MNTTPKSISDLPREMRSVVSMIDALFEEIYLVGGAVRDGIVGISTNDLDFAVPENAYEIENILSKNRLLTLRTEGKKYGTIGANVGDYDIQVTSYRDEKYSKGTRNPSVTPLKHISGDLERRDFTINAMALSRDKFLDPHNGYADIQKKILRTIGDPEIRFKEDPLRILRLFRFVSAYGYHIEENTLTTASSVRENLFIVSPERQGDELKKLLEGKYWADALNEMADSGVLSAFLKSLGFTYGVSGEDIRHEFDRHSTKELENMDILQRWHYLIKILNFAERAIGITSTDIYATAESVLNKAQARKNIKADVLKMFDKESENTRRDSTKDELEAIKREISLLKSKNDPKSMIEEAKYYSRIGKYALDENKYALAKKEMRRAIDITEKNYKFILEFTDLERKRAALRGITSYYISRYKYYVAAIILDEKLYQKFTTTDSLEKHLQRLIKPAYLGKQDTIIVLDSAIAYIYRKNLKDITLESFSEFLNKANLSLPKFQKERYLTYYIESKIRNDATSVQEKSKLYLMKAKIAAKEKTKDEYGLEYYDPYIDYLYNKMLSQTSLKKFHSVYNEFEDVIQLYITITEKQRRLWAGKRKRDLTAASALVYALSLTKTLEEKVNISRNIVMHYKSAGRGFEKNALRYQVYVDWFIFAQELFNSSGNSEVFIKLSAELSSAKSSNYVDVDEDYLSMNKADIVKKRSLLKDSIILISALNKQKLPANYVVSDKILSSIVNLLSDSVLTPNDAFTLFKNYVSRIENQHILTEKIEISDEELKRDQKDEIEEFLTGESEIIEYKSSWSFDTKAFRFNKERKKSDSNTHGVIKDIAGFMNKRGGQLFIGIEDDCNVCGLEETDFLMSPSKDPRKKIDNLQLEIRNGITQTLGKEIYAQLSIELAKHNDKSVLIIKAPPSPRPVIYSKGDIEKYYVRSGTSTDNAGMQAVIEKYSNLESA